MATTINTGFYSDLAYKILKEVEFYVDWVGNRYIPITRNSDNEILVDYGTQFQFDQDEARTIKKYIANKIKDMTLKHVDSSDFRINSVDTVTFKATHLRWKNHMTLPEMTFNVKDLVFMYSYLNNQKRSISGIDNFAELIGTPLDPIQSMLQLAKQKKIAEIEARYSKMSEEITSNRRKAIREFEDQMYKKSEIELDALKAKKDEEIAAIGSNATIM